MLVSGGDSAEVRVHLYERSFPEEPDRRARAVNGKNVRTTLDTGAAFGGVTGIAPSRRMTGTSMWGVSDPRGPGVGRRRGQPNGGRSRPTGRSARLRQRCRLETGGTERRRQQTGSRRLARR